MALLKNYSIIRSSLLISGCYAIIALGIIYLFPNMFYMEIGNLEQAWSRWDSGLYLDITKKGYELFTCAGNDTKVQSLDICGNCGWAPLYPYFIRWISCSPKDYIPVGVFLSFLFTVGTIFSITKYSIMQNIKYYWLAGSFILFAMGSVYYYAVFPMSMALFFISNFVFATLNNKYLHAGFAAGFAILSHTSCMFLIPLIVIYITIHHLRNKTFTMQKIHLELLIPIIFQLLYWAILHYQTGHWNGVFLTQAKYHHNLQSPFKIMYNYIVQITSNKTDIKTYLPLHALVGFVISILAIQYSIRKPSKEHILAGLIVVFFFLLPFSIGPGLTLTRPFSLCAAVPFLYYSKSNRVYILAYLAICLLFFKPIAQLFFLSTIV